MSPLSCTVKDDVLPLAAHQTSESVTASIASSGADTPASHSVCVKSKVAGSVLLEVLGPNLRSMHGDRIKTYSCEFKPRVTSLIVSHPMVKSKAELDAAFVTRAAAKAKHTEARRPVPVVVSRLPQRRPRSTRFRASRLPPVPDWVQPTPLESANIAEWIHTRSQQKDRKEMNKSEFDFYMRHRWTLRPSSSTPRVLGGSRIQRSSSAVRQSAFVSSSSAGSVVVPPAPRLVGVELNPGPGVGVTASIQPLLLFVNFDGRTFVLDGVLRTDSGHALQDRIAAATKLPAASFHLVHGGKPIVASASLAHLVAESTIHVSLRLLGGSKMPPANPTSKPKAFATSASDDDSDINAVPFTLGKPAPVKVRPTAKPAPAPKPAASSKVVPAVVQVEYRGHTRYGQRAPGTDTKYAELETQCLQIQNEIFSRTVQDLLAASLITRAQHGYLVHLWTSTESGSDSIRRHIKAYEMDGDEQKFMHALAGMARRFGAGLGVGAEESPTQSEGSEQDNEDEADESPLNSDKDRQYRAILRQFERDNGSQQDEEYEDAEPSESEASPYRGPRSSIKAPRPSPSSGSAPSNQLEARALEVAEQQAEQEESSESAALATHLALVRDLVAAKSPMSVVRPEGANPSSQLQSQRVSLGSVMPCTPGHGQAPAKSPLSVFTPSLRGAPPQVPPQLGGDYPSSSSLRRFGGASIIARSGRPSVGLSHISEGGDLSIADLEEGKYDDELAAATTPVIPRTPSATASAPTAHDPSSIAIQSKGQRLDSRSSASQVRLPQTTNTANLAGPSSSYVNDGRPMKIQRKKKPLPPSKSLCGEFTSVPLADLIAHQRDCDECQETEKCNKAVKKQEKEKRSLKAEASTEEKRLAEEVVCVDPFEVYLSGSELDSEVVQVSRADIPLTNVVIIGAGPVGLMCALAIKQAVPTFVVTVVEGRSKSTFSDRQQALRLRAATIATIARLAPVGATPLQGCRTHGSQIVSVSALQLSLYDWCCRRGIDVQFDHPITYVVPAATEAAAGLLVLVAGRPSLLAHVVIFATGYRTGVPPNVYGAFPYRSEETEWSAFVGTCTDADECKKLVVTSDDTDLCSQSNTLSGKDLRWLKEQLSAGQVQVFVNNTLAGITVAVGAPKGDIRKHLESISIGKSPSMKQLQGHYQGTDHQKARADFPPNFVRCLLEDGLRSHSSSVVAGCHAALEWLSLGGAIKRRIANPDHVYLQLIDLLHVEPKKKLLTIFMSTTIDLAKFPHQKGVDYADRLWYVTEVETYSWVQTIPDVRSSEWRFHPYPTIALPPHSLAIRHTSTSAASSSSSSSLAAGHLPSQYIPPFLFTTPDCVPSVGERVDQVESDETDRLEFQLINAGNRDRNTSLQALGDLLRQAGVRSLKGKLAQPAVPLNLMFKNPSVIDIRVRYLAEPAKAHNSSLVLACGDCARSPNFFGASGVNIAADGLKAIRMAVRAFATFRRTTDRQHLLAAVTMLNQDGVKLNQKAIDEHQETIKQQGRGVAKLSRKSQRTPARSTSPA